MKDTRNQNQPQGKIPNAGTDRHMHPENKDNLDSRENLEINDDPSGNNKKEVHGGTKDEHNETMGSRPNG